MENNTHNKNKYLSIPTCNVCGNELIIQFSMVQDPMTNECFAIYKCSECGLGHTFPQPESLMKYYDKSYYGSRHGLTESYCIKRRMRLVSSAMKDRNGNRLLDIGCGDGSFLLAIKHSGWEVTGIETNPNLESTEEFIVRRDIDELFNCTPFDCITMWHTLEHMQDISTMVSQIYRILKPGGILIIVVPNNSSFQSKIFKSKWLHLDVPRHLYHLDVSSLQYCLKTKGFVVQNQRYQELEYDLLGWAQSALNCILNFHNVFFNYLRGKKTGYSRLVNITNLLIGIFLVMFFLPIALAEKLFKRSGTIITIASKDAV